MITSKPTRAQVKAQMEKVNRESIKLKNESAKLDDMTDMYYGEVTYSMADADEIIDCLDYGQGEITFKEFDKIMKKINSGDDE